MLKKMRWRFIASAMAAILAVVLVLVGGMNLWNSHLTTQRQDEILSRLMERELADDGETAARWPESFAPERAEGDEPSPRGPEKPERGGELALPGLFGGHSPEFQYTLRYFVVRCDDTGAVTGTDREFIASVTTEEAAQWAGKVAERGRTSGYLNGYRYLKRATEDGWIILFLNSEREIQATRTLLLVSLLVALIGLLVVFGLVVVLSRRAIAPYVRNIETQKRFITDAGHELKTPLTAISACADVLAMDAPDSEWVASIQTECARMSKLVSDLVTLSRLDEERPFPERADFSLSEAVWEIAEPTQTLAKARQRSYEQTIQDGIVLHGDKGAIQQMVSILLDNAMKYSAERGRIRLSLSRVKGRAQIQVFNTCDLSGVEIDRLFDRFYRPDASRSSHTGGTGIGLSIARSIAQAHGGSLTAQAGDGGITFTARF